jgi:hypothetical protein
MANGITDSYRKMGYIKKITTINIMHHEHGDNVWIKHPDMQEMIDAQALSDLGDFVEMLFQENSDPALKDCLDRARIVYKLRKQNER